MKREPRSRPMRPAWFPRVLRLYRRSVPAAATFGCHSGPLSGLSPLSVGSVDKAFETLLHPARTEGAGCPSRRTHAIVSFDLELLLSERAQFGTRHRSMRARHAICADNLAHECALPIGILTAARPSVTAPRRPARRETFRPHTGTSWSASASRPQRQRSRPDPVRWPDRVLRPRPWPTATGQPPYSPTPTGPTPGAPTGSGYPAPPPRSPW